MNSVKHLGLYCLFVMVLSLINFYAEGYIGKPFSYVDLIAILIGLFLIILNVVIFDKLSKRLSPISLLNDIVLFVTAVFIGVILSGMLTGELQFN